MNIVTISGTIYGEVKQPQHFDRSSLVQGTISEYGNATYLKDGTPTKGSQFFNFKLFGSKEQVEFFHDMASEGKPVIIAGKLIEEEFVNKDGDSKKTRYVKVLEFDFPRAKGEAAEGSPVARTSPTATSSKNQVDDDDPFA